MKRHFNCIEQQSKKLPGGEILMNVALHLEFKSDGRAGESGPGDTLRLVHALRKRHVNKILSLSPRSLDGLFDYSPDVIPLQGGSDNRKSGEVRMDELARRIGPWLIDGDEIVHAFIGGEDKPFDEKMLVFRGTKYPRQRVDCAKSGVMFEARWEPPDASFDLPQNVLAVSVRVEETRPMMNTPEWFQDVVRDVARELGWRLLWIGGRDGPPAGVSLIGDEDYLSYGSRTLLEQIVEIQSRAASGVGWNSGGLDIVSTAGLPVLRIGEYQKRFRSHPLKGLNWGEAYNSYLACSTNIGLAPESKVALNFSRKRLRDSLFIFLSNHFRMKESLVPRDRQSIVYLSSHVVKQPVAVKDLF